MPGHSRVGMAFINFQEKGDSGMKKKLSVLWVVLFMMMGSVTAGNATILFSDGFETAWSGDYAPGWVNAAYRHGPAPVGKMMQQTTTAYGGTYGLQLTAASVPETWMWWAAVEVESLPHQYLDKQYDPYISVYYYDEKTANVGGQVYAVPDWVNLYISGTEDWTDVQFGARFNQSDNYYYVAAGENSPGWQNTSTARSKGWHQLKFQLSSVDGKIHFYIDGSAVGTSYRDDYTNLGCAGLYTMFLAPLSAWGTSLPYTLWDNFEVGTGTPVPEPSTMFLLGIALAGLACTRGLKKA